MFSAKRLELQELYPRTERNEGKIYCCKILEYRNCCCRRYTEFVLLEMHHKVQIEWSEKLRKVLKGVKCECPERKQWARVIKDFPEEEHNWDFYQCKGTDLKGKIIQIRLNDEIVKIKKSKRCIN